MERKSTPHSGGMQWRSFPSVFLVWAFVLQCVQVKASLENDDMLLDNSRSTFSRNMATSTSQITNPSEPRVKRSNFPQTKADAPHICLAFLSCCDRTDLLNHTMAAVIRHMEEDEPSVLRYEIAWVDNGSQPDKTQEIADAYQIEHALRLPRNMGLAYGMNLLIFNLCQAPYILLLEEDWLYLDEVVAPQTPERKRAIATSIALLEATAKNNVTSFDDRNVMGVFLRHESYESFLQFPLMDNWDTIENVNVAHQLESSMQHDEEETCETPTDATTDDASTVPKDDSTANIDYRIFCGDLSFQAEVIWGSYTNGAGLYRRSDLMSIGRMYGEPGDTFHDRYVESNYAYRAAMKHCHAALRLTDDQSCDSIFDPQCTGAFHHIGGGRGTRPMNTVGTTCDDLAWNFFGTPMYEKYHKFMETKSGRHVETCSKEELEELRQRNFRDRDADEYRKKVKEDNEIIFQEEKEERERLKMQADLVEQMLMEDPDKLRAEVHFMADKSDDEIRQMAQRLRKLASSPHPLEGYWDSHGRVVKEQDTA